MASWEEAAAHAYALWRKGQMPLSRMDSLAQSIEAKAGANRILSKVFPKAQELVKSVCSWIRGSGVSPTDFLAKIVRAHKEGLMASEQTTPMTNMHDATDARQRHRDEPYELAPRAEIPEHAFN
jgi:hypothetical protein